MIDNIDLFNLIEKICKYYPQKVLEIYEPNFNDFLSYNLKSYDKKRISKTINIIEEWIKNYKSSSSIIEDEGAALDDH